MGCHCPENFSTLEKTVRQRHFGQKRVFRQKPDFGLWFSRLLKPTVSSLLSSLKKLNFGVQHDAKKNLGRIETLLETTQHFGKKCNW